MESYRLDYHVIHVVVWDCWQVKKMKEGCVGQSIHLNLDCNLIFLLTVYCGYAANSLSLPASFMLARPV